MSIWKSLQDCELTHSSVHHLMAVFELVKRHGYARNADIARYLEISRASVSITLRKLVEREYVEEDSNHFFRLSEKGLEIINGVIGQRRILQMFFSKVLGLPPALAEMDACKIEHLISRETAARLHVFCSCFLSPTQIAADFRHTVGESKRLCDEHKDCQVCETACLFPREIGADQTPKPNDTDNRD